MSVTNCIASLGLISLLSFAAACSDSNSNPTHADIGFMGDGSTFRQDGYVPSGDLGVDPNRCQCSANQVCDSNGNCIPVPQPEPTDYVGEIMLLRQTDLGERTLIGSTWPTVGKPKAEFRQYKPWPEDFREVITTAEGESCYYEFGTYYPWSLENYDWWPKATYLTAGMLTINIVGGAGKIVLSPFENKGTWIYSMIDPDYLREGQSTYKEFVEEQYVPAGARFTVEATGGAHFPAEIFSGGEIPLEFNMIDPPYEQPGVIQSYNAIIPVNWTPAQPSATMLVSFTQKASTNNPDDFHRLRCHLKDDGEARIPAIAFKSFNIGNVSVYMERDTKRYIRAIAMDGNPLHLDLIGRHARYGSFEFVM